MSDPLVMAPILVPLATALVMLLPFQKRHTAHRAIHLVSLVILIALEVALMARVRGGDILAHWLGNWTPPFGIVVVADLLAVIMLLLASITALAATVFSLRDLDADRERFQAHPLTQFLLMGINGAFLTGDLFNMFVWYEVMLISSYGLLTLGGEPRQLRVGIPYLALGLFSSALFLVGATALYGVTGTLNLADLSVRVAALEGQGAIMANVASVILLGAFGIKAALFPLYFWLPDGYPAPPVSVATFFAGIMTKVGVYSLLRVFTLVFRGEGDGAGLILPLAGFTMLVGVLGAICQTNLRRLLSFHIISQVGYMVMGIGMFTPLGVAGGIIYLIHHIMVKASLFLISGVCEKMTGRKDIGEMGGLLRRYPFLATLFFVSASSLAGLPPLSGFFAKFVVLRAGFESRLWLIVAASLVASLLTLFSMMKIWQYVFWRREAAPVKPPPRLLYGPAILLTSFSITLAVAAEPLFHLGMDAAHQLLDPGRYIETVLGGGGT